MDNYTRHRVDYQPCGALLTAGHVANLNKAPCFGHGRLFYPIFSVNREQDACFTSQVKILMVMRGLVALGYRFVG
jgi:hypothetical protein